GDRLKVTDGNVNHENQKIPIKDTKDSRKCMASKHQDNRNRETTTRTIPVHETTSNAMGNPQQELHEKRVIDSGCSRHMTGNMSYLSEYEEIDGGYVAFGGDPKGGKITEHQTNGNAGIKANINAGQAKKKTVSSLQYSSGSSKKGDKNDQEKDVRDQEEAPRKQFEQKFERLFGQGEDANTNSTNILNIVSLSVNNVSSSFTTVDPGRERVQRNEFKSMFRQEKDANGNRIFTPVSAVGSIYVYLGISVPVNAATLPNADLLNDVQAISNNLELTTIVSPIPITRIHKDHPKEQIVGDPLSALQTRRMTKTSQEHAMMDVKNAFLYGIIEEDVYVCQPPSFENPHFPNKVYKVEKALYGLHQAPRAWYETLSTYLLENRFRRGIIDKTLFFKKDKDDILKFHMSSMGELTFFLGLQVMQKDDGIFISPDKYVANILKKVDFSLVNITSTPIETNKALLKDKEAEDVDVHLFRLMIGSLMYLTASTPDIIYLKGPPKLGLWYPKDSPFNLEAFSDSDYARASLDKKSTIRGCQFLGKRLISWQCKKQTVVANSTTEAEFVAAANCYG
nr:hypothetical protein [Tanacetum cinerariifolium]